VLAEDIINELDPDMIRCLSIRCNGWISKRTKTCNICHRLYLHISFNSFTCTNVGLTNDYHYIVDQ